MKKITTVLLGIVFACGAGMHAATDVHAQETTISIEEELRLAQIEILERRIIELLQEQIAVLSGVQVSPDECILRYTAPTDNTLALQTELQRQGYAITKLDGKYGPETTAAVAAFQMANNLTTTDGAVNDETRKTLAAESISCGGNTIVSMTSSGSCTLSYSGTDDVMAVQSELQRQGYAVTKIDGKYGPETRTALAAFLGIEDADSVVITDEARTRLAQSSLSCVGESGDEVSTNPEGQTDTENETVVTDPQNQENQEVVDTAGLITLIEKTPAVRSSTGVPDDTVVFTYKLQFNNTDTLYIPADAGAAFDVNLYNQDSSLNQAQGIDSIVSTASRIRRSDDTTYFVIQNGDTISLRSSIQPGVGMYYGELARLSYTTDNAGTVAVPNIVQYGFDAADVRTDVVRLLN